MHYENFLDAPFAACCATRDGCRTIGCVAGLGAVVHPVALRRSCFWRTVRSSFADLPYRMPKRSSSSPANWRQRVAHTCSAIPRGRNSRRRFIHRPSIQRQRRYPLHNEMSYAHDYPSRLFFYCESPASEGGETTLADSRRILARLSAPLRERFAEKCILYVQRYHGRGKGNGLGKSWAREGLRDDRRVVGGGFCTQARIAFEWHDDGSLTTRNVRPATVTHPITHEEVWFNQIDQWHPSSLDSDIRQELESNGRACTQRLFRGRLAHRRKGD